MTQLFQNVLTASFHGSIVILAVIILRLVLKKTPKKFLCLLWLLAGIRLLMPFEIRSDLSLQPDYEPVTQVQWQQSEAYSHISEENQPVENSVEAAPAVTEAPASVSPAVPAEPVQSLPAETHPTVEVETKREIHWLSLLPWVWLAVAGCFAIYSLYSYLRLKYQVREAIKIPGGWECDRIDTAFILGFLKPRIYIPMGMPRSVRKHILAHERTHLEKGDHWFKMIGFLALAIHWFNPLVWVAYILLCKDIEMACDERVVQFMELEERKAYSAALLSCSTNRAHFAACPVAFGEVSVKYRIKSVLNYKKPSFWISLAGVIAIVFVAVCLVTSPTAEVPDANAPAAETLSPEEQARNDTLKKCHEDLEALFAREEFYYDASASNDQGSTLWLTELYKQGNNTMWKYNPSDSPDVTDGRLEYEGNHYAYQSGSWIQTDSQDEEFDAWLNLYRWDLETAELVEEKQTETGYSVVFTSKWESEDKTVHTSSTTYSYNNSGDLQNIRIEKPNHPTAGRVYLDVIPISQMWGEPKAVSDFFIEAENAIAEGMVTSDELAIQAEFDDWGIYFRVDDDRLSSNGSDVYFSQSENGRGVISTTEQYWFEKKVNGNWEMVPTVNEPRWSDDGIGVAKGSATYGYLDWTSIYGSLEPGDYRMGKTFKCYDDETRYSKEHAFYSEFSIVAAVDSSSPEAKAAVERCYSAFEELKTRDHIHFKTYADWEEETWVNGSNYLQIRDFGNDNDNIPENNGRVDIAARWDGIGYSQVRTDPDTRGSEVVGMQLSTLSANRAGWNVSFAESLHVFFFERSNKTATFPEGVGVISDEMVRFVLTWPVVGMQVDEASAQLTYKFDENGKLIYMEYKSIWNDHESVYWAEVYDTSAAEIDAKIKPYTENLIVDTFSWEEAKAKYTDEEFNIREDSFVNNGGSPISGPVDAARLALKEYPNLGEYLSMDIFRDKTTGMWKVTIESYVDYQSTYAYRDVYLSDSGATQLLVYEGPIRFDESRK